MDTKDFIIIGLAVALVGVIVAALVPRMKQKQ